MSNTKPCSECQHYDPILRGAKPTSRGWCVKKSLYPYIDSPGQTTPVGAVRVSEPDAPAKPHIVLGSSVQTQCLSFTSRPTKLTKAELFAKAKGRK